MGTPTTALRIYGKRDLRLETFELPEPTDDEILAEVVSNSICMSSHKAAVQGAEHKRVPDDVALHPTIVGHEFAGTLLKVGRNWRDRFEPGMMFGIQPAMMYKGSLDAPGYSFPYVGGNATRVLIPREVMLSDCLLPCSTGAFFKASLAEPLSCIVGAFRASYHWRPGTYDHRMGIKEGGNCALLAAAGPMGLGAIDFALHGTRKPRRVLVTDVDPERFERARRLFPPEKAAAEGIELAYLNPAELEGGPEKTLDYVRGLTGGEMMDDVFVFYPSEALVEQADAMLARNGCLNFFAGPSDRRFSARVNFYNVHYEGRHIAGVSGGNTEDMKIALRLMGQGRLDPTGMVTHVGGLNAAAETILNLPDIPGGKKLIYTHLEMPLTPIDKFRERAESEDGRKKEIFGELARLVEAAGGFWNAEAEKFLLRCDDLKAAGQ
ncbi:MAG: zinc-binding dehydrogenase [Planctomycetes bacterium]|nr:zinc-binding dehydrogenase [Planctomycetota bacterium]